MFEVKPKSPATTRRELLPVAERLVYKQPKWSNSTSPFAPIRMRMFPANAATVTIKTVNEDEGGRLPAVVMLAVVDKSGRDDGRRRRRLAACRTHFLLTTEVRPAGRFGVRRLPTWHTGEGERRGSDLLLGTQGWRRFAEQNPEQFRKEHNGDPAAERLLFAMGNSAQKEEIDLADAQAKKIAAANEKKLAELQTESDSSSREGECGRDCAL